MRGDILSAPVVTAGATGGGRAISPVAPALGRPRVVHDALTLLGLVVVTAVVRVKFDVRDVLWQLVFASLVLVQLASRAAYRPRLRPDLLDGIRRIVAATAVAGMATLTLQLVFDEPAASTDVVFAQALLIGMWLTTARVAAHVAADRAAGARAGTPTLVVGAGRVGQTVAARLLAHPGSGLRPIGFLDKEPLDAPNGALPVLGASWDLERVLETHDVGHVVIAFSTAPSAVMIDIARRCERSGVTVTHVPRLFESVNGDVEVEYLGGIPLLTSGRVDPSGPAFACKYVLDRVAGFLLLLVFAPLLLVLALAVLVSVGRPVLFRQVRIGRNGRPFEMLKFRSMRASAAPDAAEAVAGLAPGGVEGADRRTKVGTFLRRTSLDELPQLLNVVRGDMSLVGPRPERPRFVELFEESVYRYGERHRVKVGMTGWAQVHGLRGKTSLDDRVEWDNHYIENWSPWLDLKTILLTISALVRARKVVE